MRLVTSLRTLSEKNQGQLLPLTAVLIAVLVVFSLGLFDLLYFCHLKIKAQNAADQLALSAATLRANLLNQFEEINGALYVMVLQKGQKSEAVPYTTQAEAQVAKMASAAAAVKFNYLLQRSNVRIVGERIIDRLAEANGINQQQDKLRFYPATVNPERDLSLKYRIISCTASTPPEILRLLTEISQKYPWFVQIRVELHTKNSLVGGKYLGFLMPDIVAKSRVEIIDQFVTTNQTHSWHVKFGPVDAKIDQFLEE